MLLAIVAAQAVNPPGAPTDHFLSYKTKTTKGTTKFAIVRGRAFAAVNFLDFVTVAQRALDSGRSFFDELDVQAEHEEEVLRSEGVHTTVSCLGPFCLVNDISLL